MGPEPSPPGNSDRQLSRVGSNREVPRESTAGFDHAQRSVTGTEPSEQKAKQGRVFRWPPGRGQEQAAGARSGAGALISGPNRGGKPRKVGHDHPILNRCGPGWRSREP